MVASPFRWFDGHRQTGSFWTKDEREKGVYVAKRALRRGDDPLAAVKEYMGMDHDNALMCARRARAQLSQTGRRTIHLPQ